MKEKGIIRAHGCSCHKIEALREAAQSPWVDVMLSRINPIGSHMDADPETVKATLAQGRANGKGIIGMKILGQGDMRTRQDEALKYALSLGILDAFTIGAESAAEQDGLDSQDCCCECVEPGLLMMSSGMVTLLRRPWHSEWIPRGG